LLGSGLAFAVAGGVIALCLGGWLAFRADLWLPIPSPSLAWISSAGVPPPLLLVALR
jgi:hypothetical protein